jgi:hypothetical protein
VPLSGWSKKAASMNSSAEDADTEAIQGALATRLRSGSALAIPPLDLSRYSSELAELDLTEEQEAELLKTLYFIMATFVDLGFGVDSVTRALPALADFSSSADSDALEEKVGTKDNEAKKGPADG